MNYSNDSNDADEKQIIQTMLMVLMMLMKYKWCLCYLGTLKEVVRPVDGHGEVRRHSFKVWFQSEKKT